MLWESYGTSVVPSQGDIINPSVSYENGYITFSTNGYKKGNAVIAAYDDAACSDGHVLWSWHIWCTDYPSEQVYRNNAGTLMDRHLGACSSELGNSQAFGLLYQWGRKDPFMGFSLGNLMVNTTNESVTASSADKGTLEYAISHPTTVIYNSDGNWLNENDPDLWSTNKTKYDPCPHGWKVPDSNTWINALFAENSISSEIDGRLFTFNNNQTTWYPTTGNRDAHGVLREYGKGFCWTNAEVVNVGNYYNTNNSFFLYYTGGNNPTIKEKNYDCHKSCAFGVRCAKDNGSDIVYVTGISLDKTSVELHQNEQITLQATVIPNNAVNNGVTWSSSNTDVATVDEYGTVTAIALGTATITANAGGYKAECSVTVQVPLSISLNMTSAELLVAERVFLKASTSPIEDAPVTWASSDTNIATVDETGKVTALSLGEAIITASAGGETVECHINVIKCTFYQRINNFSDLTSGHYLIVYEQGGVAFNGGLETLDVVENNISIIGSMQQRGELDAAAFYYNSSNGSIKSFSGYYIGQISDANGLKTSETSDFVNSISFSSQNVNIVSNSGAVLRFNHNEGQHRFRFYKSSSYTSLMAIQLYKLRFDNNYVNVTQVSLNKSFVSFENGESITLVATVYPTDASNSSVIWSSSNPDVASVNHTGTVTAKKEGVTTITATAEAHKASCTIVITDPLDSVISFEDPSVKELLCVGQYYYEGDYYYYDYNRDGELTKREAAAIPIFSNLFKGRSITSFNEYKYFTGLGGVAYESFRGCSNLSSIVIPSNAGYIGEKAFYDCINLSEIVLPQSINQLWDSSFFNCKNITSITIPKNVTQLGNGAFQGCSSLASVVFLGNNLKTIGKHSFYNCSDLISIIIPEGITSIGNGAFRGCSSLSSIVIPNSVTSIGNAAFYGCSSLSSIVIPNSVTSIEGGVFDGCISLSSIVIPNSVTSIGNYAFSSCYRLNSVIIPNSVTIIGECAFQYCRNLHSVTLPESVTSIGSLAFYQCDNLAYIEIKANTPPTIDQGYGLGIGANTLIYVPSSSVEAYKADNRWKLYLIQGKDF